MSVRIYEVDKGFAQWVWLCKPHKERREAMTFLIKADRDPPHDGLDCLDCHFGEPTTTPTKGATSDGTGV
jgi:hypothetical protein